MTDYDLLCRQMRALSEEESWYVPLLANASALLYESLPCLNWAGFYWVTGDRLTLGPFQGKTACIQIARGKGVCGAAWAQDATLRVADVHLFPGHIACDAASSAEIVVPLRKDGRVIGVMDLDSPEPDRFDARDQEGLERFARLLEQALSLERQP